MKIEYCQRSYDLETGPLRLQDHALMLQALLERDGRDIEVRISDAGYLQAFYLQYNKFRHMQPQRRAIHILDSLSYWCQRVSHHRGLYG